MENDLIRRGDVLDKVVIYPNYSENGFSVDTYVVFDDDVMSIPAVDAVERGVFEQVAWERDIAIKQLADIGKSLGEKMDDVAKVVHCRKCVFREDDGECTGPLAEATMPPEWFCAGGQRREEEHNAAD